jgi:hypothetical protein
MLEVANQTEEDATHYVSTRTNDKYDYIIYELVKAFESGNKDIAITNEILKIIESVQKNYVLQAEKARKHHIAQAIDALCEYVKTHPEKAICEILNKNLITISDDCDNKDFANLKKIALEINSYLNSMQTITHKMEELAEKRNSLHFQVLEKINFYRSRLDQLWYAHSDEEKRERSLTRSILHAWDDADMALFNNWDIQNIGNLPQDDKSLVSDIKGYISEYKQWRNKNNDMKYAIAKLKRSYTACWAKVSCLLKKDNRLIEMLLSNEILIKFDLNVSNENFVNELNNGKRNQIITELKAQKDKFVKDIVKSLADNYTQTSIIDSQYNPTKLELFRTYYRLKNNPNTEIKTFEKQLTEVEAMYNSFVK